MNKLSIITPVYNTKETLDAYFNAIDGQTCKDFELILIDDGSTDGSSSILEKYAANKEHVTLIRQAHAGIAAARNKGLKTAAGNYVYFADADDVMESDAVKIMLEQMTSQEMDLLTFGYYQKRGTSVKEFSSKEGSFTGEEIRSDYTAWTSDSDCKVLGSCWNKCFCMNLIRKYKIQFPDLKRNEEEVFIMRYMEHAEKIHNIPDVLYTFYPIDLKAAWKRLPDDFCEQVEYFRKERLFFAEKWNCSNQKTREFIAKEYWGKMMLGLRLCFNPGKKAGYQEFSRRIQMLLKGLDETGNIPVVVTGSTLYKLMKKKLIPVVWFMVKRNSR